MKYSAQKMIIGRCEEESLEGPFRTRAKARAKAKVKVKVKAKAKFKVKAKHKGHFF